MARVFTQGGASSSERTQFKFYDDKGYSDWMAFTGPPPPATLLVIDLDVADRVHGRYVAVSAWKKRGSGNHVVH